ncbi:MAG: homoserine dehydrogenase [Fimbriimonadales bacterium]|nr:MAG: homoserine dehydrogenase [Fimbriimonadales bacterium]
MRKTVRLAILGAGTVGGGVWSLLRENADLLEAQTGKRFEVRHVLVRQLEKQRAVAIPPQRLTTDAQRAVCDPQVDIVLELMGGLEPARALIRDALQAGKHVITANKLVMAVSGDALIRLAQQHGVRLLYEASVAGSLPILNALQGSLAGNRITRVVGVVNSTTNFILREMERALDAGEPAETAYETALRKAQELGYAEADPTSDVEGYDAQYKTAILARLAFLQYVPLESVYREGITHLSGRDLLWAKRLNMGLKLLSISERLPDGRLCARVHPTLIPHNCPLQAVQGAFNGVWLQGNGFQEMSFHGFGAGARATASAVVGDLIELARHPKPLRWEDPSLRPGETAPIESLTMRYFVRLNAPDENTLRALREPLLTLNAEFHPSETLEQNIEQVALTPPQNEGEFQAILTRLREQAHGTVQAIRLL